MPVEGDDSTAMMLYSPVNFRAGNIGFKLFEFSIGRAWNIIHFNNIHVKGVMKLFLQDSLHFLPLFCGKWPGGNNPEVNVFQSFWWA